MSVQRAEERFHCAGHFGASWTSGYLAGSKLKLMTNKL